MRNSLDVPPLDIPIEYWVEHVIFGLLYVMFRFSTSIFYRGVQGFAADSPCGVRCRGLTSCLLYVGPLFEIKFEMIVGLWIWHNAEQYFHCFLSLFIIFYRKLNASQYDNTLFSFTLFSCLKYRFLHSTSVLSILTDVLLILSTITSFMHEMYISHLQICALTYSKNFLCCHKFTCVVRYTNEW